MKNHLLFFPHTKASKEALLELSKDIMFTLAEYNGEVATLSQNNMSVLFFIRGKIEKFRETKNKMMVTGKKDLVTTKFTLGTANVHLLRFSRTHKQQTAKCKKLTKANVHKEWPVWKAVIQAGGPWK